MKVLSKALEQKAIKLATQAALKDKARYARLAEIEAGVTGSVRNPSDSDQDAARIGHGDIMSQRPELYAEWAKLKNDWDSQSSGANQFRNKEAKELFNRTYWKIV